MNVMDAWTGATADALRRAFRMTIEEFAEHLGISPRAVAYWRERPDKLPRPLGQRVLDATLESAPENVKARFALLIEQGSATLSTRNSLVITDATQQISVTKANDVLAWVESTNTSDDLITYFDQTVGDVAREHASAPPAALLVKVQQFHGMIQTLLRSGKQRYRQTAELMRLDADLLAHMCQLLGDLHRDRAALAYGNAAVSLADEAGASSAAAFSAQSQRARWRGQYAEAVDLAAKGLRSSPSPTLRVLLAYQEADAAAASGRMSRRAQQTLEYAEGLDNSADSYSVWSCPPARSALFRMGVALNIESVKDALRLATEAEPMWRREKQRAFGTWAHFRLAAARAHMLLGSAEGAVEQVIQVLDLPPEYRLSTLSGHVARFDALLSDSKFANNWIGWPRFWLGPVGVLVPGWVIRFRVSRGFPGRRW